MSVLDQLKEMREGAKSKEVSFFKKKKSGNNLAPNDLQEGKTVLRIAPNTNPDRPVPFYPFRSTWLDVDLPIEKLSRYNMNKLMKDKSIGVDDLGTTDDALKEMSDDDLKVKLKAVLGNDFKMPTRKRIFIATMHGKEGDLDLVEEYIRFTVKKVDDEVGDAEEAKKKKAPLFGWRDPSTKKWNPGITPSNNYICYGWNWNNNKSFHKIELWKKMMDSVEELYNKFDEPDAPLTVDPFSDPKEGIGIQIDKYKNDKGKWDFTVLDVPMPRSIKNISDFYKMYELGEDQLKELQEATPLEELYGRGSFKYSDFEMQLNGLFKFDQKHKFNTFENEEFVELVGQIEEQFTKENNSNEPAYNPLTKEGSDPATADIEETFSRPPESVAKPATEAKENSFPSENDEKEESNTANDSLAAMRKRLQGK